MNKETSETPPRKRGNLLFWMSAGVCILLIGGCYRYITTGGLTARRSSSALEEFVAHHLVDFSVPSAAKARKNPLQATEANASAGRDLYKTHCEVCHGFDGRGKTKLSGGLFPTPINLSASATTKKSDGELFYFIRNGVRNTAMPGWQLPDQQTWQLVAYLRQSAENLTACGKPLLQSSERASPPLITSARSRARSAMRKSTAVGRKH